MVANDENMVDLYRTRIAVVRATAWKTIISISIPEG